GAQMRHELGTLKDHETVVKGVALISFGKAGGDHARNAFELQCRGRLLSTRATAKIETADHNVPFLVELVEFRIVIFKCYRRHFFWSHIVAVSVFAAVNTVGIQIVLINEENTTAHTWWKTGNELYRACYLRFLLGAPNCHARRALGEICWRANKSGQRAGRYHCGRTQIYVCVPIAHATFKIAIGRADRGLAFLHQTASQADAGSATGRQRNRTRTHQSLPITSRLG